MKTLDTNVNKLNFTSRLLQLHYQWRNKSPLHPSSSPYNITISHQHKLIWFRVAKVASRTIYEHLNTNCSLDVNHPYNIYYPVNSYSDYFKFAFVRNPWDRMVSAWSDKVVKNKLKLDDATHKKMLDFNYFISSFEESKNFKNDIHFYPQSRLINLNDINFIGRFETFSQDFHILSRKIGIPIKELKHKNKSQRDGDYRAYYNDASIEKIATLYQKDIQIFNYSFS